MCANMSNNWAGCVCLCWFCIEGSSPGTSALLRAKTSRYVSYLKASKMKRKSESEYGDDSMDNESERERETRHDLEKRERQKNSE